MERNLQQAPDGAAVVRLADTPVAECPLSPRWKRISKRVAQVGFAFFLLKGIAWLVVAFLAWRGLT